MLSSLHQRPTQSWNSVFSRLSMPPFLLHLVTLFATQSCFLDVSVRQCFLVFKLFSCEDQSLLILTSKLDHFFTRASWATTVILLTITLFLITSRIECVTT